MSALPPTEAFLSAFGETTLATVTVPGQSPVTATIIWLPSRASQAAIGSASLLDVMPTAAFRRAEVPHLPRGSRVVAPPVGGGDAETFIVREPYGDSDQEFVIVGLAQ